MKRSAILREPDLDLLDLLEDTSGFALAQVDSVHVSGLLEHADGQRLPRTPLAGVIPKREEEENPNQGHNGEHRQDRVVDDRLYEQGSPRGPWRGRRSRSHGQPPRVGR